LPEKIITILAEATIHINWSQLFVNEILNAYETIRYEKGTFEKEIDKKALSEFAN